LFYFTVIVDVEHYWIIVCLNYTSSLDHKNSTVGAHVGRAFW